MTERDQLYAAICAAPRDDLPKLVFADWLDERGDPAERARAELIRIQCEWEANSREHERALEAYRLERGGEFAFDAASLGKSDPEAGRALAILERAAQLEGVVGGKPVQPARHFHGADYLYASRIRGLQTTLRITMESTWETGIESIAAGFPLRGLLLATPLGSPFELWKTRSLDAHILSNLESLATEAFPPSALACAIVGSPVLTNLKRLQASRGPHQNALLEILERAEHLSSLEELEFNGFGETFHRFHGSVIRNLRNLQVGWGHGERRSPSLPLVLQFGSDENRLEELELAEFSEADDVARVLARGEIELPRLAKLALPHGGLTSRGACDLLTTGQLPSLRRLELGGNLLGDLVGKRLPMAKDYPQLCALGVRAAQLSAEGVSALAHWPGFAGLRKLDLSGNGLNHAALRALTAAPAPNLRTLGLAHCGLHGSHIRELVTAPFVRSLWTLDLQGNSLDDAATRALAESPFLDALHSLTVDRSETLANGTRLMARFGDRLHIG